MQSRTTVGSLLLALAVGALTVAGGIRLPVAAMIVVILFFAFLIAVDADALSPVTAQNPLSTSQGQLPAASPDPGGPEGERQG